jgi:hypothetical protein
VTEVEATAELIQLTKAEVEPVLTTAEIDRMVAKSKRQDADGRYPSDAAWEPTWDLNRGAAYGWRQKAAGVAGAYTFSSGGKTFNRAEMRSSFLEMAREYERKIVGTVEVEGTLAKRFPAGSEVLGNV